MSYYKVGILIGCISAFWVFSEGLLAYWDGMFNATQLLKKYPHPHTQGIPFLWHGGMWGDFFLLSPLLGLIVVRYGNQWTINEIAGWLIIGLVTSTIMHLLYLRGKTPRFLNLEWQHIGRWLATPLIHGLGTSNLFAFVLRHFPRFRIIPLGHKFASCGPYVGRHAHHGWLFQAHGTRI